MSNNLSIDGVAVASFARTSFTQRYETVEAVELRRLADNSGVIRATGSAKLRTVINGKGWAPDGLAALAAGSVHVVGCASPRSIDDAGTTITLPAARRTDADHTPVAFAVIGTRLQATSIVNQANIDAGIDDVATLTAVAGAESYTVRYWPEITAAITAQTASGASNASYEWTIEAEEI